MARKQKQEQQPNTVQTDGQEQAKKRFNWQKFVIILSVVIFIITSFFAGFIVRSFTDGKEIAKVSELLTYIKQTGYLIDAKTGERVDIDGEKINKIISAYYLDMFSEYYTEEEYENLVQNSKGFYNGVGVSYYSESTEVSVVYGNSPAYKAGIRSGDIIVSGEQAGVMPLTVFGSATQTVTFLQACDKSVAIDLYVTRKGEFENKKVSFFKGIYVCSYVEYYDNQKSALFLSEGDNTPVLTVSDGGNKNLPLDTAYIKFNSFEGDAFNEIKTALEFMDSQNKTKLILDLRNNGGGQMDILAEICEYLVVDDSPNLLVEAREKNGKSTYSKAHDNFNEKITDIYVLANENTASASECLIGAMLCYDGSIFNKDKLIIEKNANGIAKTYGKGIMQTTYKLVNGGALKITTAKIYWPDGTSIHGKGIIATGDNAVDHGTALDKAIEFINAN